jgi:IclR family acetate operon transcriptional repressor
VHSSPSWNKSAPEGPRSTIEENELGVRCVGAAINGRGGTPLGAISVSAPASRMTRERCAELIPTVRAAADAVAAAFGHVPQSRTN